MPASLPFRRHADDAAIYLPCRCHAMPLITPMPLPPAIADATSLPLAAFIDYPTLTLPLP